MTYETQHVRTESEDYETTGGCSETRMDSIYRYLDGALETADLEEVKAHIQNCPECQSEHECTWRMSRGLRIKRSLTSWMFPLAR